MEDKEVKKSKKEPCNGSIMRACRILELFKTEKAQWTLKEIAEECKISSTTLMPVLRALELGGFVDRDVKTKCYSLGMKFVELGLYISLSGNITYKKSDRSFLKDLPLDRILFETDAPYLSPEPFRGKQNEPKNVRLTMERVAKELGIDSAELERISTENARRFYFKIKD